MTVTVTEFKAKCLNLIDQVHKHGQPVIITKHGKVIAKLVAEFPTKPIEEVRKKLAGSLKCYKDPSGPAIPEEEIEAYK
jgi:prevent-host-death family protein